MSLERREEKKKKTWGGINAVKGYEGSFLMVLYYESYLRLRRGARSLPGWRARLSRDVSQSRARRREMTQRKAWHGESQARGTPLSRNATSGNIPDAWNTWAPAEITWIPLDGYGEIFLFFPSRRHARCARSCGMVGRTLGSHIEMLWWLCIFQTT